MTTSARTRTGRDTGALRQQLRTRTADLHARLDSRFPQGLTSPETYAGYLVGMHRFASDYEVVVGRLPRQSFWLARDLQHVGLSPIPPSGVCSPLSDPDERLGWDYVMAGSSMGARALVRQARALGHRDDAGACFLAAHADSADWPDVLGRLDASGSPGEATVERMERGARAAFLHACLCFELSFNDCPAPPTRSPAA